MEDPLYSINKAETVPDAAFYELRDSLIEEGLSEKDASALAFLLQIDPRIELSPEQTEKLVELFQKALKRKFSPGEAELLRRNLK